MSRVSSTPSTAHNSLTPPLTPPDTPPDTSTTSPSTIPPPSPHQVKAEGHADLTEEDVMEHVAARVGIFVLLCCYTPVLVCLCAVVLLYSYAYALFEGVM